MKKLKSGILIPENIGEASPVTESESKVKRGLNCCPRCPHYGECLAKVESKMKRAQREGKINANMLTGHDMTKIKRKPVLELADSQEAQFPDWMKNEVNKGDSNVETDNK